VGRVNLFPDWFDKKYGRPVDPHELSKDPSAEITLDELL